MRRLAHALWLGAGRCPHAHTTLHRRSMGPVGVGRVARLARDIRNRDCTGERRRLRWSRRRERRKAKGARDRTSFYALAQSADLQGARFFKFTLRSNHLAGGAEAWFSDLFEASSKLVTEVVRSRFDHAAHHRRPAAAPPLPGHRVSAVPLLRQRRLGIRPVRRGGGQVLVSAASSTLRPLSECLARAQRTRAPRPLMLGPSRLT